MHVRAGLDAHRPENARMDPYMHVETALGPEGASLKLYMHVRAGLVAQWPEGARMDLNMLV